MDRNTLPPALLAALGLALGGCAAEAHAAPAADPAVDSGDTGDTGVGPCLSTTACLCACDEASAASVALWTLPLVGLAAVRRRQQVIERLATGGVLPADVALRLRDDQS